MLPDPAMGQSWAGAQGQPGRQGTVFSGKAASPCALRLPGIEDSGRAATLCWPTPGPS